MPLVLRSVTIGDGPDAWAPFGPAAASGHGTKPAPAGSRLNVGGVQFHLAGAHAGRGVLSLGFEGLAPMRVELDGIAVHAAGGDAAPTSPVLDVLDHVVVRTPSLDRTIAALVDAGLELRRIREVDLGGEASAQAFFVAGTAVLEVVGRRDASEHEGTGSEPARIWGLAFVVSDTRAATKVLGDYIGQWRPAVQEARQIATVRTEAMDISTSVALMTPRP